jgi:predicted RNA binding protein YcfA (HicA-like mRNA interferase family)
LKNFTQFAAKLLTVLLTLTAKQIGEALKQAGFVLHRQHRTSHGSLPRLEGKRITVAI